MESTSCPQAFPCPLGFLVATSSSALLDPPLSTCLRHFFTTKKNRLTQKLPKQPGDENQNCRLPRQKLRLGEIQELGGTKTGTVSVRRIQLSFHLSRLVDIGMLCARVYSCRVISCLSHSIDPHPHPTLQHADHEINLTTGGKAI